jgi:hypothetical protein
MRTGNNDYAYNSTGNALLEFFAKAGAIFKGKGGKKNPSYYGNEGTALQLFKPAWKTNKYKAMQLLMWLRDIRG